MRCITLLGICFGFAASSLAAQDFAPPPVRRDSADSARLAQAQDRWADGLRLAARGVAQLRTGVDRLRRSEVTHDSLRIRQAGRMFAGLCGTARGFMLNGRAKMSPKAYDEPQRTPTKQVATQIDSLIAYTRTCEQTAGRSPFPIADGMVDRLRRYEAAIAAFRATLAPAVPAPPPASP